MQAGKRYRADELPVGLDGPDLREEGFAELDGVAAEADATEGIVEPVGV